MKLLFSEAHPDYKHYIFPYVIWAVPEAGEKPSAIFNAGFLPGSRTLDRFYLCRQVRVNLSRFEPSSENRRILRKGEGIQVELVPREKFDYTPARREFFKRYADAKFSTEMTYERLDSLFSNPIISHLLVFTDGKTGEEIGVVTLYLEDSQLAFYYYAFYNLSHPNRSLGLFMMTTAAVEFAARGIRHLYLGTCYSESALYKTQFTGVEYFNGFRWSENLAELKFQLRHSLEDSAQHLLENDKFREEFYPGDFTKLTEASPFSLKISPSNP